MTAVSIAALNIYPVKSCRGIPSQRAKVTVRGLTVGGVGDREWMIVDGAGRFVTQRELPQLALIVTAAANGRLTLDAPGHGALDVPAEVGGVTQDVVVWGSTVRAYDMGDAAADWLSRWLGTAVRLVRFDASRQRLCSPEYAGNTGAHTAFADGYPILVVGEGSLVELNRRLVSKGERTLPMNRFRPNVVLAGLDAHDEDHLETIDTGGVRLRLVKPCTRCRITTTDQDSAEVGIEPLRTLGSYRNDDRLGGVTFGMNAIVESGAGRELVVGVPASCSYRF